MGTPSVNLSASAVDLSVIVVTHNRAALALETLASAREAGDRLQVEWIVVDSGSTDGTPEAIAAAHPDVRVVREPNIGFAAANNRGLQLANGRYVLLLNPDVTIASGTFDDLLECLDERTEIGMASVRQCAPDRSLQFSIRRFPSPWLAFGEAFGLARFRPWRRWREEEPSPARYEQPGPADWLVGAFLVARREAVQAVGNLDERFFMYSEEIDWCYRFWQLGWTVHHLPVMTVIHHTGSTRKPDLMAQLSYAKLLFAAKHYGRRRTQTIRAALVMRHALRGAYGRVLSTIRPDWAARAEAERRALAVVLGRCEPPFQARVATQPLTMPGQSLA